MRRRSPGRVAVVAAALVAAASACSFAPEPESPAVVAELPPDFATTTTEGGHEPLRWWETFEDPALGELIDTALAANLDLRESMARLEELRNRYRIARSPLFPAVSLNADATRSSSPANTGLGSQFGGEDGAPSDSTGPGISFAFPDRFEFTTYTASLGFSYELDFWGRLRNEAGAASHDYVASRADHETVRLAVIASTISSYFEIMALREQVALLEDEVDVLQERAELTNARYLRGLTGSFELYSFRQLYRTAQANLPVVRTQLADAEGRLAVILGRYAGRIDDILPDELEPSIDTTPVSPGLPVTLLGGRPDVIAAFERVESARLRVGARRAEQLPTISLNGAVGFQSGEPVDLFRADQWFLNLVGGLVAPIFQGGRIRANIGVADAQYDQALTAYARTVLTAYYEVRTSLIAFDNSLERYARTVDQLDEAEGSLATQLQRFQRGVGDYVSYLDARVNLANARRAYIDAERGLAEARLAVHRSLGGGWVEPVEDRTQDEELQGPEMGREDR
ncbi:MAG: TolC family protein [Gemmatimonadota bacterium]|nr:TolC family protein [Gemmatimonadota bacterium]